MFGLTGATVRYGSHTALDDVTIEVPSGHVVTIVGGDGAGKSTALRALAGEVPLAAGSVRAPGPEAIGYLPASAGSWLDLTVAENLAFVGTVYGLRGEALAERAAALLDAADLTPVRDRLSRRLSGGMRRKLGFSLAMLHQPPLLILDEPSTGVDPVSRLELWRLITGAAARGAAVITSTTYLDEAERASQIVVLEAGQIVVQGEPSQVIASFPGTVTETDLPVRRERAWRRGNTFHELWEDQAPAAARRIEADLEDIVIAMTLRGRTP